MNTFGEILFIAVVAAIVGKIVSHLRASLRNPVSAKQEAPKRKNTKSITPLKYTTDDFYKADDILCKAQDAESDGKYQVALGRLNKIIPPPDGIETRDIISVVTECFCGLYEEKGAVATLKGYDSLLEKYPSFVFAVENGGLEELANTLETGLEDNLPKKDGWKKLVELAKSPHPLVLALQETRPDAFADALDSLAPDYLDEWEPGEYNHLPPDIFIEELTAVLEGRKNIQDMTPFLEKAQGAHARACSHTRRGSFYDLDIHQSTCTCPDWTKHRGQIDRSDPMRLCKHLAGWYGRHPQDMPEVYTGFAPLVDYFAARSQGFPVPKEGVKAFTALLAGTDGPLPVAFVREMKSPWANAYTPKDRYGFSLDEKRWSYGKVPEQAEEISRLMVEELY